MTPIANELHSSSSGKNEQQFYPLDLGICDDCKHIQLLTLIDSSLLFSNYPYLSNSNTGTANRFIRLAESLSTQIENTPNKFVLEVGSNDGFLLNCFRELGWKILGVDPAKEIAELANNNGLTTIIDFFSSEIAKKILDEYGKPNLIIANNVLAHTDELRDIFRGLELLMSENSLLVIEFSYVLDVFEKLLFDTIYHEHTSYHSVTALIPFLREMGLELINIERFDAHGGSARVFIRKIGKASPMPTVNELLLEEEQKGVNSIAAWKDYEKRIQSLGAQIDATLKDIHSKGLKLVGYGIPAKFATLFHVLGIKEQYFSFLVDDNALKVGSFGPGTNLVIQPVDMLKDSAADYIFLFSWNYANEISKKIFSNNLVETGVIIPLPDFEIIKKISH